MTLLNEKPSKSALAASLMALAGVIIMMSGATGGDWMGDALAFLMTVCMAVIMIIARRWPRIPTLHASLATALLCSLISIVPAEVSSPTGMDWIWLAFAETPPQITLLGGTLAFTAVGLHIILSARRQD